MLHERGWTHAWGVGRHILGSQIFDYWQDAWGDKHEHYCDGDLYTADRPTGFHPATREAMSQWGQKMPASGGSIPAEPRRLWRRLSRSGGRVKYGFGANKPVDAIYPNAVVDGEGKPLDGDRTYRLHFAADALPPVKAFWSITAYSADDFLIPNSAHRYAIRDRDALARNTDGSLDLYFGPRLPPGVARRTGFPSRPANASS